MENKLNMLLQELIINDKIEEAGELANILYHIDCIDNIIYSILCNEILLNHLLNYKKNEYFYIDYLDIKFKVGKGYSIKDVEKYFNKENIKILKLLEKNIILINS